MELTGVVCFRKYISILFLSSKRIWQQFEPLYSGTNERVNYLILSTKEIEGDYVLKVNEEILDKSNITPVKKSKTLFTYSKTIYYKKGAVAFLFSSNDLLESFVQNHKYCLR